MGPAGCRNPSTSHPTGVLVPEVWPLLLLPLPSLPLPQDLHGWRGPQWEEDQAWDLSRFLGAQVGRANLAKLPSDPQPSQWFPNFPLRAWDPFPFPRHTSGAPVLSSLHFSSHTPHPTRSLGIPPIPLGVQGPHWCLIGALVVRRCKFHVLLVCHLDSTPHV